MKARLLSLLILTLLFWGVLSYWPDLAWSAVLLPPRNAFIVEAVGADEDSGVMTSGPAQSENSANEKYKLLKITFGGSLCPVCLAAFERKLKSTTGVTAASVQALAPKKKTGHPPKRAIAAVSYDPGKVGRDDFVQMVRNNDFQFIRAEDVKP